MVNKREARAIERRIITNLREAIKKSGKTAEKVAYEAGITKQALSLILARKRRPMLTTMIHLAYGVEVPLSKLVETDDAKSDDL